MACAACCRLQSPIERVKQGREWDVNLVEGTAGLLHRGDYVHGHLLAPRSGECAGFKLFHYSEVIA